MKKRIYQIDYACEIGDRVFYLNLVGEKFFGTLIKWDDNIATLKMDDGTEKEIEC